MTSENYTSIRQMGADASSASKMLVDLTEEQKNDALRDVAKELRSRAENIVSANKVDMDAARAMGKDEAFLDRLKLTVDRVEGMATALDQIADLPDPVGRSLAEFKRPTGITVTRVSTPIGVLAMIYESRPNVGADASALAFKAGNAIILRGGKESINSSKLIVNCFHQVFEKHGIPKEAVQLVTTPDREVVKHLLGMVDYVDLVIPRGGKGLVSMVQNHAKVPTLLHLDGNCHTYINAHADVKMAVDVVKNAKMRRTGICGATESLVIDEQVAADVLPALLDAMPDVEFRGDDKAQQVDDRIRKADDIDFTTEYLGPILSVIISSDLDDAIDIINTNSSGHTESIITSNQDAADAFLLKIDSAVVMHNASTQFSDGGEFGMGAEIGIATGKMHARGPVGLEQLNTFKYIVQGSGSVRA